MGVLYDAMKMFSIWNNAADAFIGVAMDYVGQTKALINDPRRVYKRSNNSKPAFTRIYQRPTFPLNY